MALAPVGVEVLHLRGGDVSTGGCTVQICQPLCCNCSIVNLGSLG